MPKFLTPIQETKRIVHEPMAIWYCKEYWMGDSRDGRCQNGDGFHFYEMQGDGFILKAFEYFETEDGEECSAPLSDFIGLNWFQFFGFEDDDLLEKIAPHQFYMVEELSVSTTF